jgi:hypothetical protein
MSRSSVKEILHEIDALGERDRLQLERELSRRLERQWSVEVRKARKAAKTRGINQSTIDRVIERRRYGGCQGA